MVFWLIEASFSIENQDDPTIPITRTQVWIETHTRKDKSILPSVVERMKNTSKGEAVVESTPSVPLVMNSKKKCHVVNESNTASFAHSEPTSTAKYCELLNWEGKCVAIAKEVVDLIHRNICHGYTLDAHEIKVSMVTRKILDAELYKAEKNPESNKIGEVGIGDFIIWPRSPVKLH